ncbi:MAG: hypothetical protein RIT81_47130 [Deltaproteobacteria bacterium]
MTKIRNMTGKHIWIPLNSGRSDCVSAYGTEEFSSEELANNAYLAKLKARGVVEEIPEPLAKPGAGSKPKKATTKNRRVRVGKASGRKPSRKKGVTQ